MDEVGELALGGLQPADERVDEPLCREGLANLSLDLRLPRLVHLHLLVQHLPRGGALAVRHARALPPFLAPASPPSTPLSPPL